MVRDDLADVDLADRVFAPHYVQGLERIVAAAAGIHENPKADSGTIGVLSVGTEIEVFDVSGGWAWVRSNLGPGYIRAEAIAAS